MAPAEPLRHRASDPACGHRLSSCTLRGESIAYGGLALAWSLYNALILTVVCFICIEQPRKERFVHKEAILLRQGGKPHLARLADLSGTRMIDPNPFCDRQRDRMPHLWPLGGP